MRAVKNKNGMGPVLLQGISSGRRILSNIINNKNDLEINKKKGLIKKQILKV
jgi:hypothetical protein